MKLVRAGVAAVLLGACALAQAQWAWKDANGRPVYSDQPPPASVPAARVFKAPRGHMPDLREQLRQPDPAPSPSAPTKAAPTLAERNAAYEQRRAAAAELAGRAADEAKSRAQRTASCENARQNQRALEGGGRIVRYNDKGEREVLGDAQRAEESRRSVAAVAEHCK
ncbi:DUF4124 domain-containing protein [Pseudoduganella chitinolytica]|uniref:DUF4124 domain-containing protein n=1 Tax=Pseudoduganella chitinolytica TaxID=34070 RepID=A0ABY8BE90_9BURK|nr:DUF4124 domain-containing protein [Pseudoduganella chitinolytica]WEF34229.1 DUF4124 domain-containing protein [Pseudoduganella chitinolytica]